MFAGITANQHHDTAGVQHFFETHIFPWLWTNTQGLKDSGALMYVRSDGCRAQFKCGRHFRWQSNFPQLEGAHGLIPIWSHFESCHGKDMSDPECGRYKYLMAMAELRGDIIKTARMPSHSSCGIQTPRRLSRKRSAREFLTGSFSTRLQRQVPSIHVTPYKLHTV